MWYLFNIFAAYFYYKIVVRKTTLYITLLLIFSLNTVVGQQSLYQNGDGIEINYSELIGIHYVHTIKKGHTLYSLSKLFQIPSSRIKSENNIKSSTEIRLESKLIIPFDEKLLYTGQSISDFTDAAFIPVYYTIKPKETLYRVAKVYFNQDVELILKRNELLGTHLAINQKLLMGWLPVEKKLSPKPSRVNEEVALNKPVNKDENSSIPDSSKIVNSTIRDNVDPNTGEPIIEGPMYEDLNAILVETPVLASDSLLKKNEVIVANDSTQAVIKEKDNKIKQVETGLAYWNKSGSDKINLFVLHPKARINSLIEIFNPQLQRRTFAKVLGRIPANMYSENIDVIVSPKVAQVLGVLNTEFRVRISYYE